MYLYLDLAAQRSLYNVYEVELDIIVCVIYTSERCEMISKRVLI